MKTVFFLVICLFVSGCPFQKRSPILLKAGERQWTLKEFEDFLNWRLRSFEALGRDKALEELQSIKQSVLDELIFEALAERWARRSGLKIPQPQISPEERKAFRRRALPLEALASHKMHQALRKKLKEHLSGQLPDPPLKDQKDFYLKNKKAFFEPPACFLSQILVSSKGLGKSLRRRLEEGESFGQLASLYSEKGHPGWVEEGRLEIFDRACDLEKGSLSPLWESAYGFHIFRAGEKRRGKQRPFAKVQGQILKNLKLKAEKKAFQAWLREEIQKTPVFIDKKLLDQIHIQYKN